MQSIVTWNQLLSYLFIILTIYYVAVLAVCYRQEVLKLASCFKRFGDRPTEEEAIDDQEPGVRKGIRILSYTTGASPDAGLESYIQ